MAGVGIGKITLEFCINNILDMHGFALLMLLCFKIFQITLFTNLLI